MTFHRHALHLIITIVVSLSLLYCSIKAFGSILDSLENLDFQFDLLTKIGFGIIHQVQLDTILSLYDILSPCIQNDFLHMYIYMEYNYPDLLYKIQQQMTQKTRYNCK